MAAAAKAVKYWYLHQYSPRFITAIRTTEFSWFIPELNIIADGSHLFRTRKAVTRARRREMNEQYKRKNTRVTKQGRPTKYKHLRVVEGGLSKETEPSEKDTKSSKVRG